MVLALLISMAGTALPLPNAGVAVRNDDPPVKVWLNHDSYFRRGDKARVTPSAWRGASGAQVSAST